MVERARPRVALSIAGSDSGGGAGIQADLKTFAALGVYGTSAITAVTAQNTVAVTGVEAVTPELLSRQIAAVVQDIGVDAVKTGMLKSAELIRVVAEELAAHGLEKVVVDPVMVAKSGDRLLDEEAVRVLADQLIPRALVVTPNLPEAEALVGFAVVDESSIRAAARQIVEMGAKAVVIKGGHGTGETAVDWLYDGRRYRSFGAPRLDVRHTHGTGCTFSAAIAAGLARRLSLERTVEMAKRYLTAALARGVAIGEGHGPVDHFVGATLWMDSEG